MNEILTKTETELQTFQCRSSLLQTLKKTKQTLKQLSNTILVLELKSFLLLNSLTSLLFEGKANSLLIGWGIVRFVTLALIAKTGLTWTHTSLFCSNLLASILDNSKLSMYSILALTDPNIRLYILLSY